MKKHFITFLLIFMILFGFSVVLYPSFSNWWNESRTSRVISSYQEDMQKIGDEKADEMIEAAHEYNRKLYECGDQFGDFPFKKEYDDVLNISDGVIGYISIPVIQVEYPIYHGVSDDVLNVAVGHIEGTSLPVGGENTHAVLSAHRGLPTAKLFSDLDKMEVGDVFTINVLDNVMTYRVEEILIIKPDEVDELRIIPGGDYVTLLTCTPYGINTHRLLIRSKRIDNEAVVDTNRIKSEAMRINALVITPFVTGVFLVFLFGYWWICGILKKKRNKYWYIPFSRVESWDERKKDW